MGFDDRFSLLSLVRLLTRLILFSPPFLFAADCIPIHEAANHVGETKCVTGKVLHVRPANKGVHFISFCEDQMACPFTVVVFSHDLKMLVTSAAWKAALSRFTAPSNSTTDAPK